MRTYFDPLSTHPYTDQYLTILATRCGKSAVLELTRTAFVHNLR